MSSVSRLYILVPYELQSRGQSKYSKSARMEITNMPELSKRMLLSMRLISQAACLDKVALPPMT